MSPAASASPPAASASPHVIAGYDPGRELHPKSWEALFHEAQKQPHAQGPAKCSLRCACLPDECHHPPRSFVSGYAPGQCDLGCACREHKRPWADRQVCPQQWRHSTAMDDYTLL